MRSPTNHHHPRIITILSLLHYNPSTISKLSLHIPQNSYICPSLGDHFSTLLSLSMSPDGLVFMIRAYLLSKVMGGFDLKKFWVKEWNPKWRPSNWRIIIFSYYTMTWSHHTIEGLIKMWLTYLVLIHYHIFNQMVNLLFLRKMNQKTQKNQKKKKKTTFSKRKHTLGSPRLIFKEAACIWSIKLFCADHAHLSFIFWFN